MYFLTSFFTTLCDIVHFEHKLSCFNLVSPKTPHINEDIFLAHHFFHDSPEWYDIVHFEHKLSCFNLVGPKTPHINEDVFLAYKFIIID